MHKKLFMFMVILSLILNLSGCNQEAQGNLTASPAPGSTTAIQTEMTGQEVVKLLNSTTDTTTSIEFDSDYNMSTKITAPGLEMEVIATGNMKFKSNNDNPQYYMTLETGILGMSTNILMIMADGKAYYEIDGEPIEIELADMETEFNNRVNSDISEDAVKSFTTKKDGNNTVYEIFLDPEKLTGLANDLLEVPEAIVGAEFGECKIIATTDNNNNPLNYAITMNFSANVEEMTMDYEVNMEMTFNSFKDVEIDLSKLQAE